MCQDMKNIRPSFDPWEKPEGDIPPGYQDIKCNFIFDIKMGEKFFQKSRFATGGHMKDTPAIFTYASIVSRDLVFIALNIADFKDLTSCHVTYRTLI